MITKQTMPKDLARLQKLCGRLTPQQRDAMIKWARILMTYPKPPTKHELAKKAQWEKLQAEIEPELKRADDLVQRLWTCLINISPQAKEAAYAHEDLTLVTLFLNGNLRMKITRREGLQWLRKGIQDAEELLAKLSG